MKGSVTFDESAWTVIELLLPDDTTVRGLVLEDFLWFMKRNKKYKSNKEKVEDYIRHLQLKANPVFDVRPYESQMFKRVDIKSVKEVLVRQFECL